MNSFIRNARTFAALTLVSRVLGLVRDALIARTFGVSALGTAFSIAFQFPNTFRRLFGEGALSAAFIPEYAQLVKHDAEKAHRFASLTSAILSAGLGAIVLLLEVVVVTVIALVPMPDVGRRALILTAIMLPYMPLICLTAAFGGMLQTHGRFAAQAGAPIILNLCMIAAAWSGAHALELAPETTALVLAGAVTIAGFLQLAWCLIDLRGYVAWTRVFHGVSDSARRMLKKMVPVVIGLGALQIATLIESWVIVGWPIYVGDTILDRPYPLDVAAGSALYNAQRLYQFPLGIFGIALATAVFPLLARQADEHQNFAATLRRALRLALFIGLPATVGLVWVAHDLTAAIYLGGKVTPADAERMARNLIMYSFLVGTYSLTHVLTRAFYAKGETSFPTRISMVTVALSLGLGVFLMWSMQERGLALASSIAAFVQVMVLAVIANRRLAGASSLFDRAMLSAAARVAGATGMMLGALALLRVLWPHATAPSHREHVIHLGAECAAGAITYLAAAWILCREELTSFLERSPRDYSSDSD